MKFGTELSAKIYEPWRTSYVQFQELKTAIKQWSQQGWTEAAERELTERLKRELIKVFHFVNDRVRDLDRRIAQSESAVSRVQANYEAVADTLAEILFDVNDLARFHQLNMAAFQKIVKSHDKHSPQKTLHTRFADMLDMWPLDQLRFDVLIVRISSLNDLCRLQGHRRASLYDQGEDQTAFERATAKYWIHPDHVTEVKSIILMHLPIHVFNQKKPYESEDAAVSSVYFDNPNFDLYTERLERTEGSEAIRLRWYGRDDSNVYIERKTHHAPWMNGHSVKDRFKLKLPLVNAFVKGQYTADDLCADLRRKAKLDEVSIGENRFVCNGVQESIHKRQLKPMCRVFYNRTAFQLPGDQRLRLSLDCNMTFVREDDANKRKVDGVETWRRPDVGIEHPFRHVAPEDILRFPYAVLETKIQTHLGQEMPTWLTALLTSHLVHEVPRFSKYLHGASQLFRVPVLPWWLSELDVDIRNKAPMANVGLTRSLSFQPLINGYHRRSLTLATDTRPKPHLTINLLDGDHTACVHEKGGHDKAKDGLQSRDLLTRLWKGWPALNKKEDLLPLQHPHLSPEPKAKAKNTPPPPRARVVPMRKSDPKAFFANERTFISWLQFCALLLTVSLNLLNYGDQVSRLVGAFFIIIASVMSFYALTRFQVRAYQMRTGRSIMRMDDLYGPTVLCVLMVTALGVNFYLRAPLLMQSEDPQ